MVLVEEHQNALEIASLRRPVLEDLSVVLRPMERRREHFTRRVCDQVAIQHRLIVPPRSDSTSRIVVDHLRRVVGELPKLLVGEAPETAAIVNGAFVSPNVTR